ncbi:helicase RepA family protein [Paraburkholderia tropica]|uniref:helicase RepA family protein n=1 Tax=Paraburkholderia tropica TaxID=92647 RepID=UPI002AB78879|nr:helicase RepA family protein [Paraburkholderia tropica]
MSLANYRLDVRAALTAPPPNLDYVLPGLLAATVGALVGPGASGKTMLLIQTACDIAAGAPIGGGILTTGFLNGVGAPVVLVFAEESRAVIHHRLQAAIQGMQSMREFKSASACSALAERLSKNLRIYPMGGATRDARWSVGRSQGDAKVMVEACEGARLVVVDPLRRFHAGEENDAAHMSAVVEAFEGIATETGAAVILSHHTNRNSALAGAGELASAARGSSALTDGVRWQANLSAISDQMASRLGILESERASFVRLDIAKANYMSMPPPTVLRRDSTAGTLSIRQSAPTQARKRIPRRTGATNDSESVRGRDAG